MRRTRTRVLVGAGLAAGTVAAVALTGSSPAGAGSTTSTGWQAVRQAAAAASGTAAVTAPDTNITGAQRLRITTRTVRAADVDTGPEGQSGGDYFVFEERLTDRAGKVVGSDSARCMLVVRTFRCDATFFLNGRGSIEVSGSLRTESDAFAVTGGTGDFRNARGQARIVGGTEDTTDFVFALLP